MKQETIKKLKEHACKELDSYAQNGFRSETDVNIAKNLVSMCHKLCDMEEVEGYSGYSRDGGWTAEGQYSRALMHNGTSWDDGNSYADRGNYSRDYQGGMSGRRGRSMTTGRYVSRAEGKDAMIDRMEEMLQNSELPPESARAIRKAIDALEKE